MFNPRVPVSTPASAEVSPLASAQAPTQYRRHRARTRVEQWVSMNSPAAETSNLVTCDVVVVGAGPAGSAAAFHAARAGLDVVMVDMADVPGTGSDTAPGPTPGTGSTGSTDNSASGSLPHGRDKTCGDGLTPRAVAALESMGALHLLNGAPHIQGLKLHGFGGSVTAPWPSGSFPQRGSAIPRSRLDAALARLAIAAGARFIQAKVMDATSDPVTQQLSEVAGTRTGEGTQGADAASPVKIRGRFFVLAEGVRSGIARKLGVQWDKGLVHGIAARSYIDTPYGDEPWIHSHLELNDSSGTAQPGYGWVFPLGNPAKGTGSNLATVEGIGKANLGCGVLATTKRPAKVNTKKLLRDYARQVSDEWGIVGEPTSITSALLPMGGAVSRVAGPNWAAIGDTAALVNPLNGEGIDYALESAELLVRLLVDEWGGPERWASRIKSNNGAGIAPEWTAELQKQYGLAFGLARRLAVVLTMPGLMSALGPIGMRGPLANRAMGVATRLMGNLVSAEDRDVAAKLWRGAGRVVNLAPIDKPFAARG